MAPIRTRAQNRRKSEVSQTPSPLAPIASVTRSSNLRKTARRRKSFKIEVLADLTSSLNVAEQRKFRRKSSFHPDSVPLIKATPLTGVRKESPTPSTRSSRRRRRIASYRASLHVHWAENLRRVAPISPSSCTSSVPRRGQVCRYMRSADSPITYWIELMSIYASPRASRQTGNHAPFYESPVTTGQLPLLRLISLPPALREAGRTPSAGHRYICSPRSLVASPYAGHGVSLGLVLILALRAPRRSMSKIHLPTRFPRSASRQARDKPLAQPLEFPQNLQAQTRTTPL